MPRIGFTQNKGQMTFDSGTAAEPSIAFEDDTDTGIFTSTDDTLGFSTGGAVRLTINDEGALVIADITAPGVTTNKLYADSGILYWNGGNISAGATALQNVVEDTTPQLGGDLDVNGNDIVSSAGTNIQLDAGDGTSTAGGAVNIYAGQGASNFAGGGIRIESGAGGSTVGAGGFMRIYAGTATTLGAGGDVKLHAGDAKGNTGGEVTVKGGDVTSGSGVGGDIIITGGYGNTGNTGGAIDIDAGAGNGSAAGADVSIDAGAGGATGIGGTVTIYGGSGGASSGAGGDVTISSGAAAGSGASGNINITTPSSPVIPGGNITIDSDQNLDIVARGATSTVLEVYTVNETTQNSGGIFIHSGNASSGYSSGGLNIFTGTSDGADGSDARLATGNATSASSGDVAIETGDSTGASESAGNIELRPGAGSSGATDGAVVISPVGAGTAPAELRFLETAASGTEYIGFKAPADIDAATTGDGDSVIWTLPEGDGEEGEQMATNGSGVLTWTRGAATKVGSITTVDATTTTVVGLAVPAGEVLTFTVHCHGFEPATGDTKSQVIHGAIKNLAGTTGIIGTNTVANTSEDAGGAGWSIAAVADDGVDALEVDVTGEAAHTINWTARLDVARG